MLLRSGFVLLAMKLQETATAVSQENIRRRISDCLTEHFEDSGHYAWLVDVFGDDKSGECVYAADGRFNRATYKLRTSDNKATCSIDFVGSVEVVPQTSYIATESASGAGTPAYTGASRSSGSAGNGSRNGVPGSGIQEAGRGAESSEVGSRERETSNNSTLKLCESATTLEAIILREAKADYEIKLIAPGKGSSAFYPAEVLKRDGPSVFKEGTHVYLNHPTAAEESQRPEGDVKNLAGVLTTQAAYHESHAKGPGLYARMKVFADHGQIVEEKAAHVGMSIRASGIAEAGGKLRDGLPVLKQLTGAESVDIVTKAGAGGMVLTESANTAQTSRTLAVYQDGKLISDTRGDPAQIQTQEAAMDAAELTKLQESIKSANDQAAAANAANAKLLERALRGDAREEAGRILVGITLPDSSKARVIDSVLREALPKSEAGELDKVKFTEAVNAAAKAEGVYVAGLIGAGAVVGMGSAPVEVTEQAKPEEINARSVKTFMRLGLSESAAKAAVAGRVA